MIEKYLSEHLSLFLPIFIRALGFFSLLPLGSSFAGLFQRVGLAAGMALLFTGGNPPNPIQYLMLPVEFLIGLIIALPMALVVELISMCGELFDVGRGQSIGSIYDPNHAVGESQMEMLCRYLSIAILLIFGVLEQSVVGFDRSVTSLPPFTFDLKKLSSLGLELILVSKGILSSAFTLSLPFLFCYLLLDLCVGILGKIIPSVVTSGEAFQLKSWIGLLLVYLLYSSEVERQVSSYAFHLLSVVSRWIGYG